MYQSETKAPLGRSYKKKTMENIIQNKMDHWLKTINNEELRNRMKSTYIVTGGTITSMLQGEMPNDFDVYFSDVTVLVDVVEYYLKGYVKNDKMSLIEAKASEDRVQIFIKSAGILQDKETKDYEYFEMTGNSVEEFLEKNKVVTDKPYQPIMITTNAISLNNDIQIITRFCGNPDEIHLNFDFTHTKNYFTEATGVVFNHDAVICTITKELKYQGSRYPICSLFRLRKFIKRGWTITAGEILKISWDISKLDLGDVGVLQDQLTGVDAAYFNQLIVKLKDEKPDGDFDRVYLINLIDRVFDEKGDE